MSSLVRVPSTSLMTSLSLSVYRYISAEMVNSSILYSMVFFPYFKFNDFNCQELSSDGCRYPMLSTVNFTSLVRIRLTKTQILYPDLAYAQQAPRHTQNFVDRNSPLLCFTTMTSDMPSIRLVSSREEQNMLMALLQLPNILFDIPIKLPLCFTIGLVIILFPSKYCIKLNQVYIYLNHQLKKMLYYLLFIFSFLSLGFAGYVAPLYAEWAHHHVVWINGKEQNEDKFLKMIDDYQRHGIKVGGALIDSAWSTGFNNFEWDKSKFPHPQDIIKKLHAKDIRVILWVTSMINNDTNIYKEAVQNKYLLNNGKLAKWWHGHGGFLDYFNPKAVQWWHKLMDKVIDIGVDGFKCDGTDPIVSFLRPWPYSPHAKRYIGIHQYGHKYYGDFYNYTKSKNEHALIMARPTDTFKTYTSWNYAPHYVMFSGWVGDQDSSSQGFKKAMYNVLKSAWNGYLNFGFDVGGYRGQNISKNIFLRWVQMGALLPFMENGGNGKHQPWVFDQETVNIYRNYVDLHYKLKPTFLTCASEKYPHKKSVITPLAKKIGQDSTSLPDTYNYLLCDNLLVAPVFEENGQAEVVFPKGSNWVYYFDTTKVFQGGQRGFYTFGNQETPLFMRSNSIIALQNEILVIAIDQKTRISKKIIHGSYSDEVNIEYISNTITIGIRRFHKSGITQEETVKVKLLGFQIADQNQQSQFDVLTNGQNYSIPNIRVSPQFVYSPPSIAEQ